MEFVPGEKDTPFVSDPSATEAFRALDELDDSELLAQDIHAVVIGGGTGAPVSLRTLLSLGIHTSAVVAMADDGVQQAFCGKKPMPLHRAMFVNALLQWQPTLKIR